MLYELRVCNSGRVPALLKRFETVTLKLWEKHGSRPGGFVQVARATMICSTCWPGSPWPTARPSGHSSSSIRTGCRRAGRDGPIVASIGSTIRRRRPCAR